MDPNTTIPDSDFYSRRKLMFLLVGGRYYTASNAADADKDYLALCGLKFPLTRGCSLDDEERNYLNRHDLVLRGYKDRLENEIVKGTESVKDIEDDINRKKDALFFLSDICARHQRHPSNMKDISDTITLDPFYTGDTLAIYPRIIRKDYAVINERLYPLIGSESPVFGTFDGRNYTLSGGEMTVTDVNDAFKRILEQKLRLQAIQRCSKVQEMEKIRLDLSSDIASRLISLNVAAYTHSLEWRHDDSIIGYDKTSKLLYFLIAPHYNYTTSRSYSEGQSAATLSLENQTIGTLARFAERNDRNGSFVISSMSHCLGDLTLLGNTIEDKLIYLRSFAHEVETNQAFYQISNSSDSSDSSDSSGYY